MATKRTGTLKMHEWRMLRTWIWFL